MSIFMVNLEKLQREKMEKQITKLSHLNPNLNNVIRKSILVKIYR